MGAIAWTGQRVLVSQRRELGRLMRPDILFALAALAVASAGEADFSWSSSSASWVCSGVECATWPTDQRIGDLGEKGGMGKAERRVKKALQNRRKRRNQRICGRHTCQKKEKGLWKAYKTLAEPPPHEHLKTDKIPLRIFPYRVSESLYGSGAKPQVEVTFKWNCRRNDTGGWAKDANGDPQHCTCRATKKIKCIAS